MAKAKKAVVEPTVPKANDNIPWTLSDSTPVGTMTMFGLVKTTNGYCVATIEVDSNTGAVTNFLLGKSQAYKEYVAKEMLKAVNAHTQGI